MDSPQSPLLAALGIDLESSLASEPRFLMDARFLGALHAELSQELGESEAASVLLQMGFVHGLRDALEAMRTEREGVSGTPSAPRLAMRMAPMAPASADGGVEFRGAWPERHEAEAVLAALGSQAGPTCAASRGYTSGWLSGMCGADLLVLETACAAQQHDSCHFVAREVESWRSSEDPAAVATLRALPFAALRDLVARQAPQETSADSDASFDPGSPVIHVWGPVMVIPFAGVDESLSALDLIGTDPGARDVRVVVLDLSGTIIDDGFGAVALEQILGAIQSWGAEAILTEVSPLSARVISELDHSAILIHKDMPEAIAAAFRIAEAQRISA